MYVENETLNTLREQHRSLQREHDQLASSGADAEALADLRSKLTELARRIDAVELAWEIERQQDA